MNNLDASQWMTIMQEDIEVFHRNKTRELMSLIQRRKSFENKWVNKSNEK